MRELQSILKQRAKRYGKFINNANITQNLYLATEAARHESNVVREAYHCVSQKISRACSGDVTYRDNYDDICGYMNLMLKLDSRIVLIPYARHGVLRHNMVKVIKEFVKKDTHPMIEITEHLADVVAWGYNDKKHTRSFIKSVERIRGNVCGK